MIIYFSSNFFALFFFGIGENWQFSRAPKAGEGHMAYASSSEKWKLSAAA
jgi:hypothetical protein